MPKISTHLHMALKLTDILNIKDETAFLLGNAYPDCWYRNMEQALKNHFKSTPQADCDLKAFLEENLLDDFNLGRYFHLWTDNRIKTIDLGDISAYDRVICDMPHVYPVVEKLKNTGCTDRRKQAVENIEDMSNQPVPLYIVAEEKEKKYNNILDGLVSSFRDIYTLFTK